MVAFYRHGQLLAHQRKYRKNREITQQTLLAPAPGKASAGQLRLKHSAQGAAATARQLTSHLRRWSGCTAAANHSTVADRAVEVAFRIFAVPMLAVGMAAVT